MDPVERKAPLTDAQIALSKASWTAGVEYGEQRGARQEREGIVEWLRDQFPASSCAREFAASIEREFAAPPEREEP